MFRSDDHAAGYLEAIIDGEGHVNRRTRSVTVVNTDRYIIERTKAAFAWFGISSTEYDRDRKPDARTPARKHQWQVTVARQDDLRRLSEVVEMCPAKRDVLDACLGSYLPKPRWEEAAELRAEGKTIREVAVVLGVPYSTAWLWVKQAAEGYEPKQQGRPRMK